MAPKNIIVCSEIQKPTWRWIERRLSNDYQWTFCKAISSGNRISVISKRLLASCNAAIKGRNVDVIVSIGPYMAFYCAVFIWLFRIKTPHVCYAFNFAELPTGLTSTPMKWFFKTIDCLVVSSNMERSMYAEYFNIPIERLEYVRWGVSAPEFNLKPAVMDKPYISTVGGNARDYKTFMAAMAELPDVAAVAVMRPSNLVGLDVPSNVTVLVNIPKDDALSVIKNSTLTVVPLAGSDVPCGHVTIVVAMYMGVPCIVTDSSGVSDYVINDKTGVLCEPNSVDSMKQAICELLQDNSRRAALSENSARFASEDCSEENYVSHFERFCNRMKNNEK